VLVTGEAGETCIIVRVLVALGAAVPFPLVRSRIDREEPGVVDGEFGRFPAGHGRMTLQTAGGDGGGHMTGIRGIVIILLVAGITVRGYVGIIVRIVALDAVHPRMPVGEREAVVVESGRCPAGQGGMTLDTVDREVCR